MRQGLVDKDGNSTEVSQLCRDVSKDHFRAQKNEIYMSHSSIRMSGGEYALNSGDHQKVVMSSDPDQAEI